MIGLTYDKALSILEKYLENGNFRKTQERFMLLELIYSSASYYSVRDLMGKFEQKNFRISRATIYNIISILLRLNLIERCEKEGRVLYGRGENQGHIELQCRNCGKVVRLPLGNFAEEIDEIEKISGFVDVDRKLLLKGLCSTCNKSLNLHKI